VEITGSYRSRNYVIVITILHMSEICHYVHLETSWAHCLVYRGLLYIRIYKIAPAQLSLSLSHFTDV
jgi:hypothetical protein